MPRLTEPEEYEVIAIRARLHKMGIPADEVSDEVVAAITMVVRKMDRDTELIRQRELAWRAHGPRRYRSNTIETAPDGTPRAVVAAYPSGRHQPATVYHRNGDGGLYTTCGDCSGQCTLTHAIDLYSVEVTPSSLVLVGRCAGCETVYWAIVPNPTELAAHAPPDRR